MRTKRQGYNMKVFNMFITAVYITFLIKLRCPKTNSLCDVFPSREIVQFDLPGCFFPKVPTTTLIIDATNKSIEKPNNPETQQVTFSL